jgi:hypothetical protein
MYYDRVDDVKWFHTSIGALASASGSATGAATARAAMAAIVAKNFMSKRVGMGLWE